MVKSMAQGCLSVLLSTMALTNTLAGTITLRVSKDQTQIHESRFDSLPQALQQSRQYPHPLNKVIRLADGKYFLEEPLVLDARDTGLTIEAEKDANPILYGGRLVTGWKPDGPTFWTADLPQVKSGQWDFRMLLVNNRFAQRSRLPASGFFQNRSQWNAKMIAVPLGTGWDPKPTLQDCTTMIYDPNDLGPWLDLKNAELTLYHMWDDSMVGIQSMNTQTNTLLFSNPAHWPLGAFDIHKYVVWNIPEGMTQPGQWYLDRTRGKIVYWPLPDESMTDAEVIAPTTESIIRIQGSKETPVRAVVLRGLSLSVTNTPLRTGEFGAGKFDGAIHVTFAHDSELTDLTILNVAGQGIKDHGSENLRIHRCHIHHTGACGILVEQGQKIVQDNHIHDVGIVYPGALGIWCEYGKAGLIAHNHVHHVPYSAIYASGTGHRIESNNVHHAMQKLHDGAGIYIGWCDGMTVQGNFVHDIIDTGGFGSSAYYMDQKTRNSIVQNNISVNVQRPTHNNMAANNTIRNNIFLYDGDMRLTFQESSGYTFENNILQAAGTITIKDPDAITQMSNNIFFSQTGSVEGTKGDNAFQDPQIRHDGSGKVTFAAGSIAAKLTINPIDVSNAGIRNPEK